MVDARRNRSETEAEKAMPLSLASGRSNPNWRRYGHLIALYVKKVRGCMTDTSPYFFDKIIEKENGSGKLLKNGRGICKQNCRFI